MPYPNPSDVPALKANADLQVLEQQGFNIGYLAFNTEKDPYKNKLVRQALNYAINKQAIIEAVFQGAGTDGQEPDPADDVVL